MTVEQIQSSATIAGYELALNLAKLAVKYDKPIIEYLEQMKPTNGKEKVEHE